MHVAQVIVRLTPQIAQLSMLANSTAAIDGNGTALIEEAGWDDKHHWVRTASYPMFHGRHHRMSPSLLREASSATFHRSLPSNVLHRIFDSKLHPMLHRIIHRLIHRKLDRMLCGILDRVLHQTSHRMFRLTIPLNVAVAAQHCARLLCHRKQSLPDERYRPAGCELTGTNDFLKLAIG